MSSGNNDHLRPASVHHRRHARPCPLELQANTSDLNESSRVAKAEPTADRFTIVIQAEPAATPAEIRLRQLLKIALRGFGFRCVDVRQVDTGGRDIAAANMGKVAGGGT